MTYSLAEFFRWHDQKMERLGLPKAERNRLFESGVPIELEKALERSEIQLSDFLKAKAHSHRRHEKSPRKVFSDVWRRVYFAAAKFTLSPIHTQCLAAATIAINNCCFGEMDEAIGRFDRFSETGHGAGHYLVIHPEEEIGREMWWCLAMLAKLSPVVIEPTGNGSIRCLIEEEAPIEFGPDSAFVGKGRLFSTERIWELAHAGRYLAYMGNVFDFPVKPNSIFLNYPLVIRGSMKDWERVLERLKPFTKRFEFGRGWLEELGVPASEIERFTKREVEACR